TATACANGVPETSLRGDRGARSTRGGNEKDCLMADRPTYLLSSGATPLPPEPAPTSPILPRESGTHLAPEPMSTTQIPPEHTIVSPESRSGLDPWKEADLPVPPMPKGLGWLPVVGPGVIILGVSIGSGEFLLGPAVFVRYGLSIMWVTTVAVILQALFNTEVMRYTLATGEPVFTGFMRTRPSSTLWAWFYSGLYFLQVGWPAWAATSAAAIFFLFFRRLPGAGDGETIYLIGVAAFLGCVLLLSIGRRIERT